MVTLDRSPPVLLQIQCRFKKSPYSIDLEISKLKFCQYQDQILSVVDFLFYCSNVTKRTTSVFKCTAGLKSPTIDQHVTSLLPQQPSTDQGRFPENDTFVMSLKMCENLTYEEEIEIHNFELNCYTLSYNLKGATISQR